MTYIGNGFKINMLLIYLMIVYNKITYKKYRNQFQEKCIETENQDLGEKNTVAED